MKLKIWLRQLQLFDKKHNPIYYSGVNPNSLNVISGTVPEPNFKDFTQYVDNLDKLNLSWRLKDTGNGDKGASHIDKGASGELTFTDEAYKFVTAWLNDHVASPLNGIEVRIEDTECGVFDDWVIKSDGLTYCDHGICSMDLSLRQKEAQYNCIQTTLITDNHLGMFNGSYQHPRFSYCNEFRPAGILSAIFVLIGVVGFFLYVFVPIVFAINVIIFAVNIIIRLLRVIVKLLGGNPPPLIHTIHFNFGNATELIKNMFIDVSGCGREHPAPLIRDYITNVCSKCGVSVTADSIPIFFKTGSDYYNATMLSAEVKKGIDKDDGSTFWIPDNDPLLTLDMLLDELKEIFNADWIIRAGTLYFDRKDRFQQEGFLYDFEGIDKAKIIDGVCYTWNEVKKPAYWRAGYTSDGFDNVANDAKRRYNDLVECNVPYNPILEGKGNKQTFNFGMTRFRQDGIYKDYLEDALKPLKILQWVIIIIAIPVKEGIQAIKNFRSVVLMSNHTLMLKKLIIWDGQSKLAARAKIFYNYGVNEPTPNSLYNPTGQNYHSFHSADITYDTFYNEPMKLFNYPFFFDANFVGNLWDKFHQIDDPRFNPPMNKTFDLKIALCCEDVKKLGLLNGGENIGVGKKVKLNGGQFYKEGRITEIEASFDPTDKMGRYIRLKGKV